MVGGAGGDESPGPDDDARDHPADPSGAGSDAELIEAVRTAAPAPGAITPADAFAELYRRHVDSARALARHLARSGVDAEDLVATAFARLLEAMRAGRGPTEAFRAYLLTSVRHLAYDRQRAERRVDLTDDLGDVVGIDPERTVVPFADPALAGLERTLAARAFATLPERWQAVLWHLEVEGDSPADIAPLFGLTANAVSALAYRAREGLRQAYLQEHLSSGTGRQDRRHRETEQRLGAYTRGGLARRDAARVEAHLAECAECRALAGELREVNSGLVRSVVAPLVLGAGLVGYLASRGSPDYLAMWDHGTGEIAARGGGTVGVVGAVGALVHPAVLSTLLVTAPGGALAVATAGVVGVVGAAGVVGVLTVGGHGAVAPPRADAPVHAPASRPTPPPHPRERPAPTPPSPLAPVPPWDAASPPDPAPRSPSPTTTPTTTPTAPPTTPLPIRTTASPTTPLPTRTTAPPTTPLPTRTTGPPRTSAPPRPSTSRPSTPHSTRTGDPRSSPDREPDADPVDEHGDDHPTRPLPLLDALGLVLAEVVSPAR